jgi:hypothetical protein
MGSRARWAGLTDNLRNIRESLERRRDERSGAIVACGKLIVSGAEQICRIREISPHGARIDARYMPQPGQRVWIEMRGLPRTPAVVVWRSTNGGGLHFEAEQDLHQMFEMRAGRMSHKYRGPRFELGAAATLQCGDRAVQMDVVDISTGGLKLRGAAPFEVDSYGAIRLEGLSDLFHGHVRWKTDDMLGFRFYGPMFRDDLFHILCFFE